MDRVVRLLTLALLLPVTVLASGPTALESFVADPAVVISFSEPVGKIASRDATLEVTAIVAEDTADPSRRLRGVKISLQDNGGIDHVWLDESQLAQARNELAEIERGIAELERGGRPSSRGSSNARSRRFRHAELPDFRMGMSIRKCHNPRIRGASDSAERQDEDIDALSHRARAQDALSVG